MIMTVECVQTRRFGQVLPGVAVELTLGGDMTSSCNPEALAGCCNLGPADWQNLLSTFTVGSLAATASATAEVI